MFTKRDKNFRFVNTPFLKLNPQNSGETNFER